jgi:superkiller protein 3
MRKEVLVRLGLIVVVFACLACMFLGCTSRNPYVTGGIIDMQQSRYDSAESQFKKALEIDPTNSDAHMWLGKAYASQRKFTESADEFDKAVSMNPAHKSEFSSEPLYFWAVYYNSGIDFIQHEKWEEAQKRLETAISVVPDSVSPYLQLSFVYTKLNKPDMAENALKTAIEKAPGRMSARVDLARFKIRDEKYEDAKVLLQEVVTTDPKNADAHYYLGLVFAKLKDLESAEKEYAQAAQYDTTNRDAFFNLGFTRMASKKYPEAVEAFKNVVKIDLKDEEGWFYLGLGYYQAKNYDLAIETFTKLIELNPKHADAYTNRGYAKKAKGLTNEAFEDMKRADALKMEEGKE